MLHQQTRFSFLGPALLMAVALWFGLWQISRAIRDTRISITVPQTKTTVNVPKQAVLPDPRSFR